MSAALAGKRIVDLTRVVAGPFCTQMLADHGAEVLKIEPPQGDETRKLGPPFVDGTAAYFTGLNRNKLGLSLDLSRPEARDALLRLLRDADVLIENFLPGTMEKWGLGYDAVLAPRFPRLVYCRISGFGTTGPLGSLPGYDAVLPAMWGLMGVNDGQFAKLCRFLGREDLLARFSRNAPRLENRAELRLELENALAKEEAGPLCERLMAAGVPAGPVHSVPQALQHPHTAAREMAVEKDGYR